MMSSDIVGLANYVNIPSTIATIVSAKLATLHEMDTVYGLEDMWQLLEINTIDSYNRMVVNKAQEAH